MSIEIREVEASRLGLLFIDGDPTTVIDVIPTEAGSPSREPEPEPESRPRRLVTRVVQAVTRVARTVRDGVVRLARRRAAQTVRYARRVRRAYAYPARHRVRRSWYGIQRSTSRRNAARVVASRAAAREGELPRPQHPPEFISWVSGAIETIRYEDHVLRHPTGRHFICS